jgi:dipeptidyl aminopeptidase/acylaminoacyl peptidase
MNSRARLSLTLALGIAGAATCYPVQKSSIDQALDSLFAVRTFKQVAISPDGKKVAWVESLRGKAQEPTGNSAIYVATLGSSEPPRRVSAGDGSAQYAEHDIAWSPDSKKLAFLSDKGSTDQLQLYISDATGHAARQLTRLTGYLTSPSWSPDGKTLALLFTENAPRAAGPLEPMTPPSGLIEQHVYEQRLTTVEVASDQVRQVSPADLYIYEYDWAPDGNRFTATAAHGAGDANWWIAQLCTIDIASGEVRFIYKPTLQIAEPHWSPDGKSIAFIGGIMSDEGSTGGDIYTIPVTGGEARDLTPGVKASPATLAWLPSTERILFTEQIDGSSGIATVDAREGKIETLWSGHETISTGGRWDIGISLAKDGKTNALVRQSFQQPPEIWAGEIGAWKQVTRGNAGIHPGWAKSESIHWWNDGMEIQGWLLYPVNYDPSKRYPMVVSVHGGPGAGEKPSWPEPFFNLALLSHEDCFVLFPNPRGSFGEGEAFTAANVKDFGYGDFRDILAGVDYVVKTLPVDDHRVGIAGWSYGGYMSMWAVTQTNRFRAAVAGAGIANWQSYYGENDIDQWMIPFFGASVYDDPKVYARSSPISFIRNVKTPTLILVGDRDGECPAPQSFEFWHALKTLGVETQLVVYPDEGHMIWQPEHERDVTKRTLEWFDQHLK